MRLLLVACLVLAACEPTGVEGVETVELTLRLKLAGDRDVGATPARVHVYAESIAVPRAQAFPDFGDECVLAATPVTVCTFSVPIRRPVSLIAAEPDPAVVVRFAAASPSDTVRDGRYVEFTGWTDCSDQTERGLCVIKPKSDMTIEANFQLLQQVSVYQTGAARMDYVTYPRRTDAQGSGGELQRPGTSPDAGAYCLTWPSPVTRCAWLATRHFTGSPRTSPVRRSWGWFHSAASPPSSRDGMVTASRVFLAAVCARSSHPTRQSIQSS